MKIETFEEFEESKIVEVLNTLLKEEKIEEWTDCLCELSRNSKEGIIHNFPHDKKQRMIKVKNSKDIWIIEDWWDRIIGKSWKLCVNKVGVILYFCRMTSRGIDKNMDDEVIYCYCNSKTDYGSYRITYCTYRVALIHKSEILEYI